MSSPTTRHQVDVKIVSHACALISVGDVNLLSDPWLFGSVFNSGWSLQLKNPSNDCCLSIDEVSRVNYLYISHEHPDHFHIPSLKWIAEHHPNLDSVHVLIKDDERCRTSLAPVLSGLGFSSFKFLSHGSRLALTESISAEIYLHRHIDSALLLFDSSGPFLINLNDAELSQTECSSLRLKYGPIPLVLNQFSLAGFDGILSDDLLVAQASMVIDKMINHHKSFSAKVTLPFASFCWFSCDDNSFLNKYHNSLDLVSSRFSSEGLSLYCLEPSSETVGFDELLTGSRAPSGTLQKVPPSPSSLDYSLISDFELVDLIVSRCRSLFSLSNSILAYLVDPLITFYIADKDLTIVLNIRNLTAQAYPGDLVGDPDSNFDSWYIRINSQPLFFAFSNSFGIQTLGVSGRYQLVGAQSVPASWRLIRILSSLDNNKTPFRLSTLVSRDFYKFISDIVMPLPSTPAIVSIFETLR